MDMTLFPRYSPVIRSLTPAELAGAPSLFEKLKIAKDGNLDICYAPFEYINPEAKIVLVGITPGKQQMLNALAEARRQLDKGAGDFEVLMAAKRFAGFSGELRANLIKLLDHVGIQRWLSISTCADLFGSACSLVQTASMLRNPVFYNGADYNGTPKMMRNEFLKSHVLANFGKDIQQFSKAVIVPLGTPVVEALSLLADKGYVNREQILFGLPHPSPQNIERIKYFVGEKAREALSVKTNPEKIEHARAEIIRQIQALA